MKNKVLILSVVVLALAGVAVALASRDDGTADTPSAGEPVSTSTGGAAARCIEQYDLTTLDHRELAFAGTLESIDGDDATFTVERWYRGGDSDAVTLAGAGVLSGLTSVSDAAYAPGDRLLVSGDGGFAWPCGFTQAYDDAVAADWAEVFAAG